jgi:hypothetical protein
MQENLCHDKPDSRPHKLARQTHPGAKKEEKPKRLEK